MFNHNRATKKLCFIMLGAYPVFNPRIKSNFGGAEVQLCLISKTISKYPEIDVSFIVGNYGQNRLERREGVKIWKSVKLEENFIVKVIKIFLIFRKINADICILRTLKPASGVIALYLKMTNKKCLYMLAHDSEADKSHRQYKTNFIKRFLSNLIFRYASLIVVQNNFQYKYMKRRSINSILIKSGYEIPLPHQLNRKKDYILWVARSDYFKRPELFLKLAEMNFNKNFIMICPLAKNRGDFYKKIKIKALKLKNLEFIEFMPFNKIDRYFQEAKIFVNTSTQEGFPNTFIQAAKNKTPIISLIVNPDNILTKYKFGYVCNDDLNEMNKRIQEMFEKENLYNKMANNAFEYASENHDIQKITRKLFDVIKKL